MTKSPLSFVPNIPVLNCDILTPVTSMLALKAKETKKCRHRDDDDDLVKNENTFMLWAVS
jgi:hypothetical protein